MNAVAPFTELRGVIFATALQEVGLTLPDYE
jgi:hypothetical protein